MAEHVGLGDGSVDVGDDDLVRVVPEVDVAPARLIKGFSHEIEYFDKNGYQYFCRSKQEPLVISK